jgi:hypothetical protein
VNVRTLEIEGERLHQELGREYYLTGSGHKTEAAFEAIYARYPTLLTDEALACARETGDRSLLEWVVGLRVGRAVSGLEERQLAWEQQAVVRVDGGQVPYLRVPIELVNLEDRAARRLLDERRAELVSAELTPLLKQRFERERDVLGTLGYADYVTAVSALSGIDLVALSRAADAFLSGTADLYREALGRLVRRRLPGVPVSGLVRSDASWAFRVREFDGAFPGGAMIETATRQMAEMGLDATQHGRISYDTDERAGKQPRAFCVPVRVPEEVYLVLRPRGGHADYRTLWHEMGHALHYASVGAAQPFAARWLGDNSVTEAFAMLWDHMTVTEGWLRRYARLGRDDAARLMFELGVHELYVVRRYAAKLAYELVLHRDGPDAPGEYAERLTEATLFRYPRDDYLADVDPWFYAARYLRAWQLEAALAAALVERFDADWYRHPRAGAYVQQLMGRGQAVPADRLAEEVTAAPLSFAALVTRLERLLG